MKKIIFIVACIFLVALASAETSFFVKRGDAYNLTFACEDITQPLSICSATTICNLTIFFPNSSMMIDNQATTNLNNGRFYYALNTSQTNTNGEFQSFAGCSDGGINASTQFIYEINPTGIRPSEEKTTSVSRAIYFTLIIAILFFIGFLFVKQKPPIKWTFFIFAILFFLITLNILFVGLQDEVVNPKLESFFDSFTAISFYVYWFLAGVLIIMWFLSFLQTWLFNRNMRNLQKYGLG